MNFRIFSYLYNMTLRHHIFSIAFCFLALTSFACPASRMTLVSKGKPAAKIVLENPSDPADARAAELLNRFVERITGTALPVVSEAKAAKGCIFIGGNTSEATEDGFLLECSRGSLRIRSGGGKGSVYAVVTLLERYMGVEYYAKDAWTVDKTETLSLPAFRLAESPAFRYRQTNSYGNEDPDYRDWCRLKNPHEYFVNNLWVHTFDSLLPSSVYGESHPEYYALIAGERRPGRHSQWCLTNPEVFEIVAARIDSIFRANPGMKTISVSQNDGNDTYCTCPACKAVDEYEGSPSGNLVRFLNALAERFPDKEFSTLSYLYSVQPPKHVRPLPNVNIMLCDIDCRREVPLTDNESGRFFMQALEGWGKISNNIFVWDYGINFDNLVSPFPNFHILRPNILQFKKNHATMLFEQVNGERGVDFSEMRAWILAKLMWNPSQDTDSLMTVFTDGYYGAAAPYMREYRKSLEKSLLESGLELWIYDSPISHKDGMLDAAHIEAYNAMFDKAEAAVAADQQLLDRVWMGRLPLQYSELEIARTGKIEDRTALADKLATFRDHCARLGVDALTERGIAPDEYCANYLKRYLADRSGDLALGASVRWILPPTGRYKALGDTALTDGLFGGSTFVESWVGWEGVDAEFVLDLGSSRSFTTVEADFLHQLGAWILLPRSVSYSISEDGENFAPLGSSSFEEDRDLAVKFKAATVTKESPVTARYINVYVEGVGLCPAWHYGVGHPAWFFLDEVTVR